MSKKRKNSYVGEIHVTSIKLNRAKKRLRAGETFILKATVHPDYAGDTRVCWTSNGTMLSVVGYDPLIVTVTAVAASTCDVVTTVTATAMDSGGKSASCKVIVPAISLKHTHKTRAIPE